jgi:hypothetical protein
MGSRWAWAVMDGRGRARRSRELHENGARVEYAAGPPSFDTNGRVLERHGDGPLQVRFPGPPLRHSAEDRRTVPSPDGADHPYVHHLHGSVRIRVTKTDQVRLVERGRDGGWSFGGGYGHFVALPGITAVGEAGERSVPQLVPHGRFDRGDSGLPSVTCEFTRGPVHRRHVLDPCGGGGQAERGQDAGMGRHEGTRHAEGRGQAAGEQWAGAAERYQRHGSGIEAALHAHAPQRPYHVGNDDLDDPLGTP